MSRNKPDNKKIEEVGIAKVEEAFSCVPTILPHLDKNDKGVCTDGRIEVYSGESLTKETLIGEIDAQVKATVSRRHSEHPKVRVSIEDLKKYATVFHGALYFKVFLNPDLTLDGIYYKQYLPYDINKALSQLNGSGQKTLSDRFDPLSDKPRQLERLCRDFVRDVRKQGNVSLVVPGEKAKDGCSIPSYSKIQIVKTLYSDELPFSLASLANGAYLYGVASNGESYAIDKLEDVCAIEAGCPCSIGTSEHTETIMGMIGEDQEGVYIKFGGFVVRFGGQPSVSLTYTGGIRERLRDLHLAKEIQQTGELIINNRIHGRVHFDASFEQEIDRHIQEIEPFARLLDRLEISAVWDPAKFNGTDWRNIRSLQLAFIEGQAIELDCFEDDLINLNFDIMGTRVKVFAKRNADGFYNLFNPMDASVCFTPGVQEPPKPEDFSPVPGLLCLTAEDYRLAANINADSFASCLERFPITEKNSEASTLKLLDMLAAIDVGAVCETQLFDCCRLLADALLGLDSGNSAYVINSAQISKRLGALSTSEQKALRSIALSAVSSATDKACAYALLDKPDFSNDCIQNLDDGQRAVLFGWPIARFLPAALE